MVKSERLTQERSPYELAREEMDLVMEAKYDASRINDAFENFSTSISEEMPNIHPIIGVGRMVELATRAREISSRARQTFDLQTEIKYRNYSDQCLSGAQDLAGAIIKVSPRLRRVLRQIKTF